MTTLYTLIVVVLLFGMTIFIHELGHFLVARWCGMVVDAFSIGFGPAIWKAKIGGVDYKIGCLPLGGYVALPQMDPSNMIQGEGGKKRELPAVAPWKKIVVSLAGVTGNMLLAFVLAWVVFWVGKPSAPNETNGVVGYVETNSVAYERGLRIGDNIVAVSGHPVKNWDDIMLACALSGQVDLSIQSADGPKTIALETEKSAIGIWIIPGVGWMNYAAVASVVSGSPAEKAGLLPGDLLVDMNGVHIFSREQLIDVVDECRDRDVPAVILRGDKPVQVTVRPVYDPKLDRALIGIIFNTMYVDFRSVVHPRPMAQVKSHAEAILRFLQALVTPKEAAKASQAVGGPLMILYMFWLTVQNSLILAIWFTGFINVNLAIVNLLPIPVLDGGHICFSLWELVTRRAVSFKVVNIIWNVFASLLILLFIALTYRDVLRLIVPMFSRHGAHAVETVTNAPAESAPAPAK